MFEEKANRYRLVFLERYKDQVIENLNKYPYLNIIGDYKKEFDTGLSPAVYINLIIDSETDIEESFVTKFNKEVNECLGTFETYEKHFD